MARQNNSQEEYARPIRRMAVGGLLLVLLVVFLFWRIDSPRAERFRAWRRVRDGDCRFVVGTRSAVFAPVHDLALLVVDEEHDGQ